MNVTSSMRAFIGTEIGKDALIASLEKHAAADSIVQGHGYWSHGKGCAVGCSLHDFGAREGDHSAYERLFGIPRLLAKLEDGIFEGLPAEDAKEWPLRFARAVPIGADLSLVWPKFAVFLLVDKDHGVVQFANENGKLAIQAVADLYTRQINGETPTRQDFEQARRNAAAAAYAAYAAYADAYADADAAAAYADDADAAAAYAAAYAADADAYAAAYAWRAARVGARGAARKAQADKLIELLQAA